nr:protein RER1B-like isoform X5 [Nicotiana tomentosiformis]
MSILLSLILSLLLYVFQGLSSCVFMEGVGDDGTSAVAALDAKPAYSFQYYLDKTTPYVLYRWIGTIVMALLYALRIYSVQGFYFVTYCLGFYIVNLLVGFLSPLVDPQMEPSDGPLLPTKASDEFKPFISRLPEFKFWNCEEENHFYLLWFHWKLFFHFLCFLCWAKMNLARGGSHLRSTL